MNPRQWLQHSIVLVALGCFVALATGNLRAANLQGEIDSMFSNLGAVGDYTQPGAFRGQTYDTYTGGSIYLRSPTKVYQLATIQLPYFKAGCGGIDVFAGSFSHLAAAEFKNVLKSITANLPGVAFQLALSAVTPLLGQKTEWAKSLETFITNARINSCETATSLVRGAANAMGFDAFSSCVRIAIELGLESDEDAARNRCRSAQGATLNAGASSGDADAKAMVPFVGNLTWQALKRVSTLDDPERELLMSIIGTVVYYSTDQNRDPDIHAPTLTSITDLLYGQADAGSGFVVGHQLKCDEYVSCMNVSDDTTSTFQPFTTKVEQIMTSISDKIANRTGVPTAQEIGFVNTVSEPVYRMLAIGNAVKGSGQADALIQKYREVIATDYAYNFLEQYFRVGMAALEKDFNLNTAQKATAHEMRDRVQGYLHALALEKQAHYGKVTGFNAIAVRARAARPAAARQHAPARHRHARAEDRAHRAVAGHPCRQSATAMYEIYAYGDNDSLYGIFNAIAAITQSDSYLGAVAIVMVCGFVTAAIAYALAPERLAGWKWLGSVLLVYSILLVPKVTVGIVDKLGTQPVQVVGNVPFGAAIFGHLTSVVGNTLTDLFETAFQVLPGPGQLSPDLSYQQHGLLFGNSLIKRSREATFPDPNFRTDLVNFIANCTMYDLADGTLDPAVFGSSTNLWGGHGQPQPGALLDHHHRRHDPDSPMPRCLREPRRTQGPDRDAALQHAGLATQPVSPRKPGASGCRQRDHRRLSADAARECVGERGGHHSPERHDQRHQ